MAKLQRAVLLLLALALLTSVPVVASAETESSRGAQMIMAQQANPSVSLVPTANVEVRLNSAVSVTATFSEPVFGFTIADVSVSNGAASNLVGSDGVALYTFDVTPNSVDEVTVDIAAGVARNAQGHANAASPRLSLGIPYDFDGNGGIDRPEVIEAIRDYLDGRIARAQAIRLIRLYLDPPTEPDRASLTAFYNATGGSNWTNNSGWLTDAPLGQWHGVSTNDSGRVIRLSLANNQLSGEIPAELGDLTSLESLSLRDNELGGEIPVELGDLTSLTGLWVNGNQLSGAIPAELGNLTSLESLSLSSNELNGEIPAELGNLASLEYMSLRWNQLSGEIPAELGNLTNLQVLRLSNNQLSGEIPAELGNLTNLQVLRLNNNQLSGEIPVDLGNLSNLVTLNLWVNQLSGEIPAELGGLTSLQGLRLDGNQLSGEIPTELGNLTSLEFLSLGGNDLGGEIPAELGDLTTLTGLWLDNNQLSGEIPTEIGNLTGLEFLSLNNNQLSDEIPVELGTLTSLQELSLGQNELSGEIPTELGNLISLQKLNLERNDLSGGIPSELGNLTSLQDLRLFENQLSGEIPAELGDLTNLTSLILSTNQLNGTIPASLVNLTNLAFLALNINQLSGEIPVGLGNLASLEVLSLRQNQLSGEIPVQLGALTNLRILYLSNNQLNGGIPAELGNLTNLERLWLHENQLTGEIPAELGDLDNLIHIELAGNQLTGCLPVGLRDVPTNDFDRLGLLFCDGTAPPQEIAFAEPNRFSAQLQTYIAKYMLEEGYGRVTRSVEVPDTAGQIDALLAGQADVLMEAWLFSTNNAWEALIESGDLLSLGPSLGQRWSSAFVIPAYLQEQHPELDSVEDLKEQRYKSLFATAETGDRARLESCIASSNCAADNAKQVMGYDLDEHVHIVNPASWEAHFASINEAYQNQKPWLGFMWSNADTALLLDLVRLEEPPHSDECWETTKACARPDDEVLIVANPSLPEEAPEVSEFLTRWDFSIEVHLKSVRRWRADNPDASIEDTGLYWLRNNDATWSGWVTDEAVTLIRSALSGS